MTALDVLVVYYQLELDCLVLVLFKHNYFQLHIAVGVCKQVDSLLNCQLAYIYTLTAM